MNALNTKKAYFVLKSLPLFTLMATNSLMATPVSNSPFYPVPAYLVSKSDEVKPNVMLLVDTSGSMGNSVYEIRDGKSVNLGSRITVAKNAFTDLVNKNPDLVRWGFSTFHKKDFIPIDKNNATAVVNQIGQMIASGNTPTVPIYYQLIRYFENLAPTTVTGSSSVAYYGDWATRLNDSTTASPIQYRCQKNFIISLSDGDANVMSYASERDGDPVFGSLSTSYTALPSFTDKAFTHDFKTGGTDIEGGSWDDPSFPTQNIITYTIGFGTGMSTSGALNLQQAAAAGGGKYYAAGNSTELVASLQDALSNIAATVRPPSPSTYTDDGDGQVAGAISINFKSANWSSELTAAGTNPNGSINTGITKPITIPKGDSRNVWFRSNSNEMSKVAKNQVTADAFGVSLTDATNTLVSWLQGSAVTVGDKRASLFGDVINGNISVTSKGAMFVLGANDGMVHVFKKNTFDGYDETFVYMPTQARRTNSGTIGKEVPALTKSNYGQATNLHRYLVDGGTFYRGLSGVTLGDKEFVVGATGRGGAGVYALDMKQIKATNGNESSVLFDVTNSGASEPAAYRDMGYTVGTPIVAYVQDNPGSKRWVTVAANGYFSKDDGSNSGVYSNARGRAGLYLINLDAAYVAGSMWKYLEIDDLSTDNGLSSPTVVDTDDDGFADYAYAGDLKGNLYRFSLKPEETNSTGIVKVFSGDPSKPITSAPAIFKRKDGKRVIIFGTGRLLTEADNSSVAPQTVYGIIDLADDTTNASAVVVTDAELLGQSILPESGNPDERKLSTLELGATNKGWKLDLGVGKGERVIYQPVIYGNTAYLTTQVVEPPKEGLCSVGSGYGYIMSLDAETGGQPKTTNSHFGDKTAVSYYAGKKVRGYVSNVGGLILAQSSSMGTNTHGQLVAGMMNLNASKKSSSLNGNGKDECKDTAPSVSFSDGEENSEKVSAPACSGGSKVRSLSWREIF